MCEQGWGRPSQVLGEQAIWRMRWSLLQEYRSAFARDDTPPDDDEWTML